MKVLEKISHMLEEGIADKPGELIGNLSPADSV